MDKNNLNERLRVEAVLFASSTPFTIRALSKKLGVREKNVKKHIESLSREYEKHAFELADTGAGYIIQVKKDLYPLVEDLLAPEISEKLLHTLSYIAYNEPVRQSILKMTIGDRIYDDVKELCSLNMVKYKRDGNTKVLSTTREFKKRFKLAPKNTIREESP